MTKTAMFHIRVEPGLKSEVEAILHEVGLSATEAITIFLNRVRIEKGIPFEVKIPNAETLEAMKDIKERRNLRGPFANSKEMLEDLENDIE